MGVPCVIISLTYSNAQSLDRGWIAMDTLSDEASASSSHRWRKDTMTSKYLPAYQQFTQDQGRAVIFRDEHLTEANGKNPPACESGAQARGQSLAQMALAWVFTRHPTVTSALIGASAHQSTGRKHGCARGWVFGGELAAIDRWALGSVPQLSGLHQSNAG
jgi:hypothetical protein